MINPMDILKVKGMWDRFRNDHPKLIAFGKGTGIVYVGFHLR